MQEAVGIDAELLDLTQARILDLYSHNPSGKDPIQDETFALSQHTVEASLRKATNQLIDDLSRNVRMLHTPER